MIRPLALPPGSADVAGTAVGTAVARTAKLFPSLSGETSPKAIEKLAPYDSRAGRQYAAVGRNHSKPQRRSQDYAKPHYAILHNIAQVNR